ncbi:MAG TPA: threonine-phosphate decarboxylase CobD [Aquamicrobium sp.]|nr:threonine-phosphate decarboxylase CobD [Aquamicrobium sp.]
MSGSDGTPSNDVADHGGSLSRAVRLFPDAPRPWLDLSTGINPHPYPFDDIDADAFTRLPEDSRLQALLETAARTYGAPSPRNIVAAPGTQILLPLTAALVRRGSAAILSPTYAEHHRAAVLAGHDTVEAVDPDGLRRSDLAIVVNPNNPDGRIVTRQSLLAIAAELRARRGLLVVDEAFMEVGPAEESLAPDVPQGGIVILRSFGKFFGLAGVRLGFAIGPEDLVAEIRSRLGPWAVPGPAIELGIAGLADVSWQRSMRQRLAGDAARLDGLLRDAGLTVAGGTSLYRFVRTREAQALFSALGEAGILVRRFDRDEYALRFGIPGDDDAYSRLHRALAAWRR